MLRQDRPDQWADNRHAHAKRKTAFSTTISAIVIRPSSLAFVVTHRCFGESCRPAMPWWGGCGTCRLGVGRGLHGSRERVFELAHASPERASGFWYAFGAEEQQHDRQQDQEVGWREQSCCHRVLLIGRSLAA